MMDYKVVRWLTVQTIVFLISHSTDAIAFSVFGGLKNLSQNATQNKVEKSAALFENILKRNLTNNEIADIEEAVTQAQEVLEKPQAVSWSDFELTVIPIACLYGQVNLKSIKKLKIAGNLDVQACVDLVDFKSYILSGVGLGAGNDALASAGGGVAAAVYIGTSNKIERHVEGTYYFYKLTRRFNPLFSGFAMLAGNENGQYMGFVGAGADISIGKKKTPVKPFENNSTNNNIAKDKNEHSAGVLVSMQIQESDWLSRLGKSFSEFLADNN